MTEKGRKLIVIVTPVTDRSQGDYVYRVRQPFTTLVEADPSFVVVAISNLMPNKEMLLLAADLVIVRMVADADLISLAWERKQAQRPTVFEIADHFLALPDSNPAARYYRRLETRGILFQLLSQCDLLQVTTPALQDEYRSYHARIHVFENQLERLRPLSPKPAQMTVAWGGSAGHFEDMQWISSELTGWLQHNPEVRLALMSTPKIRDLFGQLPAEQMVVGEPGSLGDYLAFLAAAHIGLAPLQDNAYNRCRSDIKFLEYTSAGLLSVCSNVDPYQRSVQRGETGLLFGTPEELVAQLDAQTSEPDRCMRLVDEARRYVARERLQSQHIGDRVAVYNELIGQTKENGHRVNLNRWSVEEICEGYFEEVAAPEATAVLEGMGYKDPEKSLPYFARAIEINPNYDRAFLCAGIAVAGRDPDRAGRYFRHSLALNPSAVYAQLRLGDLYARADRMADAAEVYAAAWNQCPAYVDPLVRLARMCQEAGEEQRALRHLRMAAEMCPHHPAVQDIAVQSGNLAEQADDPDAF